MAAIIAQEPDSCGWEQAPDKPTSREPEKRKKIRIADDSISESEGICGERLVLLTMAGWGDDGEAQQQESTITKAHGPSTFK
jgi:hypothetical protein